MLLQRSTSKRSFLGKLMTIAAALMKSGDDKEAEKYLAFNHENAFRHGKHHGQTPGAHSTRRPDYLPPDDKQGCKRHRVCYFWPCWKRDHYESEEQWKQAPTRTASRRSAR
jgi:hypothetical protein